VVVGEYVGEKDIVVVSGLHAGDRVVVEGVLKVVPGKPVAIVGPGEGDGKAPPKAGEAKKP
jgi:multidrug efflux pump subunit AcrA (membrane-fusion protein)